MNRVREYQKKSRITQIDLASIIGVAQSTVSEWELQKKDPSDERLIKLCDFFGCGIEDILIPSYFDPHRGAVPYGEPQQTTDAIYVQERIKRNPNMQSLFNAADVSTPEQIQAATALLTNPSGTPPDMPKTPEARILCAGIDKMPPEDRERALSIMRLTFAQYAKFFEEGEKEDDDS